MQVVIDVEEDIVRIVIRGEAQAAAWVVAVAREPILCLVVSANETLVILIVVLRVRIVFLGIVVGEVVVLVMHWLGLDFVEVVRVELKSAHLLSPAEVVSVVFEVAISGFRVRCIAQIVANVIRLLAFVCVRSEILTLMMDRLGLDFIEVMRVELESTHVFSSAEVVPVVSVVAIAGL